MKMNSELKFKELKGHIAGAIKESCHTTDVILYRIANEVHHIDTYSVEPGVEIAQGLTRIIEGTIKDSVALGCDLSRVVKGILVGAFRSSQSMRLEAHKTIRLLVHEVLKPTFKYHGSPKQMIEGIMSGIMIISKEYGLNVEEAMVVAKENILSSAKSIDPQFEEEIKKHSLI